MIDFFGISTGYFVKFLILIAFIFFALRLIFSIIAKFSQQTVKNLKPLFIITEVVIWLMFLFWIKTFISQNFTIFLIISILDIFLALILWLKFGKKLLEFFFKE